MNENKFPIIPNFGRRDKGLFPDHMDNNLLLGAKSRLKKEKNKFLIASYEAKWVVVSSTGPLIEMTNREYEWENILDEVIQNLGNRLLIIDFTKLLVISSTALQYLIQLHRRSIEESFLYCICGLSPEIREVFKITHLRGTFVTAPTLDDAKKLLTEKQRIQQESPPTGTDKILDVDNISSLLKDL